ncbi:MAG: hypothetical protein GQ574_29020 [Crocinitomix sp.]|nr:hypothetical protein [Crocinitomix sp.]
MKEFVAVLIVIVLSGACSSSAEEEIPVIEEKKEILGLMTTASNILPAISVNKYSCDFLVVLNDNGDTTHWSTNDRDFKTPEGYYIGTNWSELPTKLQNSLGLMRGWGYFIKLESGWQLGFCEGSACTDTAPVDGSLVKWIFKRGE